jgi:opacity protein-like surface antigen
MSGFRSFTAALAVISAACFTSAACAAQPTPAYSWTGWYIGLNAGGNFWPQSKWVIL